MNPLKALTSYLQGVLAELRKVTWPTLPVLINHFVSVVFGIALATLFVGVVDHVFVSILLPHLLKIK